MKTRKEPIKPSNIFQCPNCEGNPEFDNIPAFKEHLSTVHKITDTKGQRQMMQHIDCADSFHSTYEWTIGGMKFNQFTSNPRHKHDMMRFT